MAHRLDQAEDFVRLEIESAMAKGMPVIPVLVENANMRSVGDTGQHDAICYRNARPILQGPYFHAGMDMLIEQIDRPDGEPAGPKQQFVSAAAKRSPRVKDSARAAAAWRHGHDAACATTPRTARIRCLQGPGTRPIARPAAPASDQRTG